MTHLIQLMDSCSDFDLKLQGFIPRILIAEDDEDFLQLMALYLRRDGYRITCVKTATDLLVELRVGRSGPDMPALVITDDRMPGMTGFFVLEQVRGWGWQLPLVLITAFGNDELEDRARRIGVTLMRKPFDMDDLRTLVCFLVNR